ncbi:UNVERIFIED_CONTAM: hypothetical protein RKD43_003632 [Streptomyces graminofaciens]
MPALLPCASTVTVAPSQSFSYFFASSRTTGAKAVEPVTVSSPRAQPIGGRESSRATMIVASATTQTVSSTVITRAARLNSGGVSSGVVLRLGATSPSRRPPVTPIALPTGPPVSSTSSLKCWPWFRGTRGR